MISILKLDNYTVRKNKRAAVCGRGTAADHAAQSGAVLSGVNFHALRGVTADGGHEGVFRPVLTVFDASGHAADESGAFSDRNSDIFTSAVRDFLRIINAPGDCADFGTAVSRTQRSGRVAVDNGGRLQSVAQDSRLWRR